MSEKAIEAALAAWHKVVERHDYNERNGMLDALTAALPHLRVGREEIARDAQEAASLIANWLSDYAWTPRRSHVESARNDLQKIADAILSFPAVQERRMNIECVYGNCRDPSDCRGRCAGAVHEDTKRVFAEKAVPEGWQLVPKEPSDDAAQFLSRLNHGFSVGERIANGRAEYRALLQILPSAPPAPAPEGERLARKFLSWWDSLPGSNSYSPSQIERWLKDPIIKELVDEQRALLAAHAAPPIVAEAKR